MGWKRPSIRAWETLLSLSLLTLPVRGLLDTEASDKKLDSVYVGKLSAAWIDIEHTEGCGERLLGVLDKTVLTFGPVHNATTDSNPYFISLISPQTENLTVSMQSSISSEKLAVSWWDVDAKLTDDKSGYSVSGTLEDDKDLESNQFAGKFDSSSSSDSSWCGFKKDKFEWDYKVNTSKFVGEISEEDAEFEIEGSMLDETTNRNISYVIQFHGKWNSKSAKLSLSAPNPTWPNPGNDDQVTSAAKTSSILVDTGPTPTGTPSKSDDSSDGDFIKDISKKIGLGGIAGITAGAIFLFGLIGMAIFCALNRRKRHREAGKVYPEVAYIYTPSPDPSVDSSDSGYSKILANYQTPYRSGSDLDMREVLVNDHSLPVTNQHQWREF